MEFNNLWKVFPAFLRAKGKSQEFEHAEQCDDGSHADALQGHGDLVIAFLKVEL